MPSSGQAVLVFVIGVVPGFIALSGYRFGRAVPAPAEGLVAVAQVITLSLVIALVAWPLGGKVVYAHATAGTALTTHQDATFRLAVGILAGAGIVGFAAGQLIDHAADHVRSALARNDAPGMRRTILEAVGVRLLTDGPTTWDRSWREIRRHAAKHAGYVYIEVKTKSGNTIVGAIGSASRVALSPQPRDMYIEQVLRPGSDGVLRPTMDGLGMFVVGSEVESVEWAEGR
jgi:hypothetical protein